jgi:hypothetical protein
MPALLALTPSLKIAVASLRLSVIRVRMRSNGHGERSAALGWSAPA